MKLFRQNRTCSSGGIVSWDKSLLSLSLLNKNSSVLSVKSVSLFSQSALLHPELQHWSRAKWLMLSGHKWTSCLASSVACGSGFGGIFWKARHLLGSLDFPLNKDLTETRAVRLIKVKTGAPAADVVAASVLSAYCSTSTTVNFLFPYSTYRLVDPSQHWAKVPLGFIQKKNDKIEKEFSQYLANYHSYDIWKWE